MTLVAVTLVRTGYLLFERLPNPGRRTGKWEVRAVRTEALLGRILWRGSWRQYVFEPEPDTVWSRGCLKDVEAFIAGLTVG